MNSRSATTSACSSLQLDDARAEGEAAAAEQTRLALAVAEEERDAARGGRGTLDL